MMFRRKKKTPIEKARADLEKQFRIVNKQAHETRKDLSKRLNNTAADLRAEIEQLLDADDRKRAASVANELEKVANSIEVEAERRFEEVTRSASGNVWTTVVVAFALGLIMGLLFKQLND